MKSILRIALLAVTMDSLLAQDCSMAVEHMSLHGRQTTIPEFAVFGGETIKLDVAIEAPPGTKASLFYDLAQIAGGVTAPLETSRLVDLPLDFDKTTRQAVLAEIPLPKVVRQTKMLLVFSASVGTSSVPVHAGKALLQVYPNEKPGNLARSLAMTEGQSGLHLGIFGESPALRRFFEEQKIGFRDLGLHVPDRWEKQILHLGEITSASLEERHWDEKVAHAVFFVSDAAGLPGVYRTISPAGSVTKVTIRLLENLDVDPRSQELLIDTIQQALNPTTSSIEIP